MSEAPQRIDQYRELTSQERNVEFEILYQSLPTAQVDTGHAAVEARSQSKHKKNIKSSLESLLAYCSGTNAFKKILINKFSGVYDFGVDPKYSENSVFETLKLEQLNNPESGGIFDDDHIEALEEVAYSHLYLKNAQLNSFFEQGQAAVDNTIASLEAKRQEKVPGVRLNDFTDRQNVMFRNWKQEFENRYGRLPNVQMGT